MKCIGVLTLAGGLLATNAVAQSHIRCQTTIGGPCGDSSRPREMNCCDYGYCQPWNTGYYQCIQKPALCPVQETDIDYFGNDIRTIYGLPPDKCCEECSKTAGCKGYTFVNQNPDGKTACYLKSSMSGRREKKGAVSGAFSTSPPPANCPDQEIGYDYYGNDIKSLNGVSQSDCCDECGKTPGCQAYTYIERGDDGRSACYLKTADYGRRVKAGAVSGRYKYVPPPKECPAPEYNMDYYGNDIKTVYGVSQGDCCAECVKTAGCRAYTYAPINPDGRTACYLKTSLAGRRGKQGVVSSRREDLPSPPKCPVQEIDIDYFGNDIKSVRATSTEQCCDECDKTGGCAAYTFVATDSACYLKSSSSGRVTKPGAVSAAKK